MARGYGIANFGDGNYGVTTYVDATASGSVVATTSVIGGKVYYGSAAFSASSDGSAVGVFVIEGSSQDVTAVSTTASAAVEVFDGLASMGGSAVGSTASGTKVIQGSATVVAGVTLAEASLQFITNAEASTSVLSSTSANCERMALGSASIASELVFDASANITAAGGLGIESASSVSINYIRQRSVAVQSIQAVSTVPSIGGREKWEPYVVTSETWTPIPATSETWTKLAA